jgi:hypothetical protein
MGRNRFICCKLARGFEVGLTMPPRSLPPLLYRLSRARPAWAVAAGLGSRIRGTHAIRHSAASRRIQAGATLKQIADLLGHRSINTTSIDAEVDLKALAAAAMHWPRRCIRPRLDCQRCEAKGSGNWRTGRAALAPDARVRRRRRVILDSIVCQAIDRHMTAQVGVPGCRIMRRGEPCADRHDIPGGTDFRAAIQSEA